MPYDGLEDNHQKDELRMGRRSDSDTDSCDTERVKSFLTVNQNKQATSS
jgi:hypothetical protein